MGRIRTIKPEFFTDEELSLLPEITHLFAAGLLCYADDEGYFNANPGLIKAAIYPLREPSVSVSEMLAQLAEIGFVRLGSGPRGKLYGCIVNFSKHQRVSHPSPSKINDLPILWEGSGNPPEDSVNAHDSLRPEGKGKEGNREQGREQGTGKGPDSVDVRVLSERVGIFGMREQADMMRCLAVYVKASGNTVESAIDHMVSRWEQYQRGSPDRAWSYGSSYKFFMSGNWDKPETWAKPDRGTTAVRAAFLAVDDGDEEA